jgi:hypothetical protein
MIPNNVRLDGDHDRLFLLAVFSHTGPIRGDLGDAPVYCGVQPIRGRYSAPRHSHPLSRRQCVDVASRMPSENFDGAPFVLNIPSPNPQ